MQGVYKRPIADPADQWCDAADRCMNVGVLCSLQAPSTAWGISPCPTFVGCGQKRTFTSRFTPRSASSWLH